jgi:hypothetical protein
VSARAGLALAVVLCGCRAEARDLPVEPPPPPPPLEVARSVKLEPVITALSQPVWMTYVPGDVQARLFVVEKAGTVRVLRRERDRRWHVDAQPLVDIGPRLSSATEEGLLGLAFHPRFTTNRKLYIYYTDKHENIRVAEFRVRDSGDSVDYSSERELLMIKHPFNNHNGGQLIFGPDGKLWLGTGDGGWANDPFGNGQDRRSHLGKLMRLDVDADKPTLETVMIGLRNPWRFSFDRKTQDLYIADVGQDRYEEVDVVAHDRIGGRIGGRIGWRIGGQNLGWKIMEGLHCRSGDRCDRRGLTLPVVEYNHKAGCSITGGFVYRGRALPLVDGAYFYADYCTALIRSFRWRDAEVPSVTNEWDWRPVLDPALRLSSIASFAEDEAGELYIISLEGTIYELVSTSPKN